MKKEVSVIHEQEVLGKDFKVYGDLENPIFLAKDVANWIDYSKSSGAYEVSKMIKNVDDDEKFKKDLLLSGQNREMWFLTLKGVYQVLANSRKLKAKELLSLLDEKYPYHSLKSIPLQTKFEYELQEALEVVKENFRNMVDKDVLDKLLRMSTEHKALGYRVDFYFKELNLAVEYDEKAHEHYIQADAKRQEGLEEYLGATFIRVKEGKEVLGMTEVVTSISKAIIEHAYGLQNL